MQKNKIDVVKAVCNSAARNLVVLGFAAAAIGVGNAGNLSLVANAQCENPTITIDKKGVKVEVKDDSAKSNYTYFGARLNGIERVGITNGDNFVAVKNDENTVEVNGNQEVVIGSNENGGSGNNYISRRGTAYMYNPSRLQMCDDNILAILENGTSFIIRSTASDTLSSLMNVMDPETVRRTCAEFLANHQTTHSYYHATVPVRVQRDVREEREIRGGTNATTTSQNAGRFGGMLNPLNWRFFGGSSN